ncbi:HMG box domain-containing protein [Aphelenchoides besseyi]|nr:HMG box domain-containing protein [Aphelenchoides besseyi]
MSPSKNSRKRKSQSNGNSSFQQSDDEDVKPPKSVRDKSPSGSESGVLSIGPRSVSEACRLLGEVIATKPEMKNGRYTHLFRHSDVINSTDLIDFLANHNIDIKELVESFRRYFQKATQPSVVLVQTAVQLIRDYAESGESVELHPLYPPPPKSAYIKWVEDNNIKRFNITKSQLKYYNDHKKELGEAHSEIQKEYLTKLKEFLDENEADLSLSHVSYVQEKIPISSRKSSTSEEGAEKKRALSIFTNQLKKEKYTDLEPEERDRKLLKKFNKLSDEVRSVYLELEAAQ